VKFTLRTLALVFSLAVAAAHAQITQFQHIIVVFQENRTPDNLFYALCAISPCSTTDGTQYNIQLANWLDKTSPNGVTQPTGVALNNGYDLDHSHGGWKNECDLNTVTNQCRMDGAAATHANRGAYVFVNNTVTTKHPHGILASYVTLATQYGWANRMFQTNQGPSFPAHQFIFGGTSAFDANGDQMGTFISSNFPSGPAGCYAQNGQTAKSINSAGVESTFTINYATGISACLTRPTMSDLIPDAIGWKYYSTQGGGTDLGGSIWTAPNTIEKICVPDAGHQNCTGSKWAQHVDLHPADVLSDMGMNGGVCKLQGVSWVIPKGQNSDHPGGSTGGPDWVANVVNALGGSPCKNPDGSSYWNTTGVVITWDDFGGWYDHVAPQILPFPEGGYQLGFRVPMIFVSAYTPVGYINNDNNDFGSVLRFIENNFSLPGGEGALGFADSRSTTDLSPFYNLSNSPRPFVKIPTIKTARDFLNDKTPSTDVDDE
jgi:phospholipase C